jgi:hypothetical protein
VPGGRQLGQIDDLERGVAGDRQRAGELGQVLERDREQRGVAGDREVAVDLGELGVVEAERVERCQRGIAVDQDAGRGGLERQLPEVGQVRVAGDGQLAVDADRPLAVDRRERRVVEVELVDRVDPLEPGQAGDRGEPWSVSLP